MEKISRQAKRAQERKQQKEHAKLTRKLQMSNFTYIADDKNMTFSAMAPQLFNFINVIDLPRLLKEHVNIKKRQSMYSPDKLSQFMILQNLLGYDRIEGSWPLDQDTLLKEKFNIFITKVPTGNF
jgi:hypothetical protein